MKASTIPQFLILDTEGEYRTFNHAIESFRQEDSDCLRNVIDCLIYERNAGAELEVWADEIVSGLVGQGYTWDVEYVRNSFLMLGYKVLRVLQGVKAYHNGYLVYTFNDVLGGDLVLKALEEKDLQYYEMQGVLDERTRQV